METLIQFRWSDGEDELDYLSGGSLTGEQIEQVKALLSRAERVGRIDPGWYVGPEGKGLPGDRLVRDLTKDLDLEFYETLGGKS